MFVIKGSLGESMNKTTSEDIVVFSFQLDLG